MQLELAPPVSDKLRRELRRAGRKEIGGIIMAEQVAVGHFRAIDITVDNQTGSRAHFVRSTEAHGQALDEFFQQTGNDYTRFNYLGEWHSHPTFPVQPSIIDIQSMMSLVHGERGIDFAVLLIVRLGWWRAIKCSCTLFERGRGASAVDIKQT
jgi:integrative and conjugative element protein (TIGR02256 family)